MNSFFLTPRRQGAKICFLGVGASLREIQT
jgi:hypothetical protein